MGAELISRFDRPSAAYEARRELRALQKELRLGRIASIAVVSRPARDAVQFDQDGDVKVAAGARFGLVVGALLGALLLGPYVGILVAIINLDEAATAPSVGDLLIALAVVVSFINGLTALVSAVGGALLGALAAALLNFGIPSRQLLAVGEGLEPGEAALVTRARDAQLRPLADHLVLSGGTLVRMNDGRDEARPGADAQAARFASRAYAAPAAEPAQRLAPVALEAPPVDPRQRDLVVAEFAEAAAARRAARGLKGLRRSVGGLVAGNRAVVTRSARGAVRIEQAENVTARRGGLFGALVAGLAGLLLLGFLGAAVAAAAWQLDERTGGTPSATAFVVVGGLLFGAVGAALFGVGGGLLGAAVARLVNLAYDDDDLRQIAATVPPGKALLIASIYHHGGPAAVRALEARGATLRHMPLPADQLADAARDEQRRAAIGAGEETRRLVPTRAGVRIFADWQRRGERAIVLLHGAGGDHSAWTALYPALHGAGYATLALDLRGHGYSDRPRGADDYRLERFAEDVYDVLEALEIRDFIMVGHCFGGMVTTMFHQAHPDLSKGYLLLDTAAHAPAAPRLVASRAPWVVGLVGRLLELLPADRRALLHNDMQPFKGTGDIQLNRLMADASHTTLRAWLMVYRGIAQYDGVASLRSMTQPVWVVVGEEDTVFTVEDSQVIHSHVPGSKLITVPGANHIIVVNNPEVVEQLILDFISDTDVFDGPAGAITAPDAPYARQRLASGALAQ